MYPDLLKKPTLLPALALALAALGALPGGALNAQGGRETSASLAVTVTGLKATKGKLIVCLWSDKAGFPSCAKSRTARKTVVPVSAASMRLNFPNLAPGRYAVTVEHDLNGDGKLGRNFIGMPTEGVGASNNPGGLPGFQKSLVDVGPGSAIEVRIRYLLG